MRHDASWCRGGAAVAPLMLWSTNGFQIPVAESAQANAVLYALGIIVGVLNMLAQLLNVLAVQVGEMQF